MVNRQFCSKGHHDRDGKIHQGGLLLCRVIHTMGGLPENCFISTSVYFEVHSKLQILEINISRQKEKVVQVEYYANSAEFFPIIYFLALGMGVLQPT